MRWPVSKKRRNGSGWVCSMLLRVVILFLIFMLVMGMVQKALSSRRIGQSKRPTIDRLRCPQCKRVNFSNTPRACERPDCGYR